MSESAIELPEGFQYASRAHQAETARVGMWMFLASEVLFFGALGMVWMYARYYAAAGFEAAAHHTDLAIGTANTAILICGSFFYSTGLLFHEAGRLRGLRLFCLLAIACGLLFMGLKFGLEWHEDFSDHMFPAGNFGIHGADSGGARIFFTFYFVGTSLHGLHLLIGIVLVGWIFVKAGSKHPPSRTAVEIVGLYWSFVDMVWLMLYPLIYLLART